MASLSSLTAAIPDSTSSNFSPYAGLPIVGENRNMTYLYGLSDFFEVMFSDPTLVNSLLETSSFQAAEVYNSFLQKSSEVSLSSILALDSVGASLLYLRDTDLDETEFPNCYKITDSSNQSVVSAKYLSNKPFLQTLSLTQGIDYEFMIKGNGDRYIRFAHPLGSYPFASRKLSDGSTQIAIWMMDALIDNQRLQDTYGKLINVTNKNSSEEFANFLYGLYFVYVHGPNLGMVRRGLNLVLGIPLARAKETVIDIRMYLNTDQFLVITDQNSYLIPYGLAPTVEAGQLLNIGDEISTWIEVQDYQNDGEWWLNLFIPSWVIPEVPRGQKDRYATTNSHFDYLMRNYLKTHAFYVNVRVTNFKDIQQFTDLSKIIKQVKPSYTACIYTWTVEVPTEEIQVQEYLRTQLTINYNESVGLPISRMVRGNLSNSLLRNQSLFLHGDLTEATEPLLGLDRYSTGVAGMLDGVEYSGLVNPKGSAITCSYTEQGRINALNTRDLGPYLRTRDSIAYLRGAGTEHGRIAGGLRDLIQADVGMRIVPLYYTRQYDLANKCVAIGIDIPDTSKWHYPLIPNNISQAINERAINDSGVVLSAQLLQDHYITLFYRGSNVFMPKVLPDRMIESKFELVDPSQILSGDYLYVVKIVNDVVGVYWITSNLEIEVPPFFSIPEEDALEITTPAPLNRGMLSSGSPVYALRGRGMTVFDSSGAINEASINSTSGPEAQVVSNSYLDSKNTTPVVLNRSGVRINHFSRV